MSSTIRRVSVLGPRPSAQGIAAGADRRAELERIAHWLTLAAVVMAALLIAGIAGLALYSVSHDDRIYEGVTVGDVSVGGMSPEDAAAAVQRRFDAYAGLPLQLVVDGNVFSVMPVEAGASLDPGATVAIAYGYGRDGSFWKRSGDWARGLMRGVELSPVIAIDSIQLDRKVAEIAGDTDREPSDAYVDMNTIGQPALVADISGAALVQGESRNLIIAAIDGLSREDVELPVAVVPAEVSAASLTGGVPGAQAAVSAPFVLSSAEGSWTIPVETLRTVVSVEADGALAVDEAAIGRLVASAAEEVDRTAFDTGVQIGDDGSIIVVPGSYSAVVNQVATRNAVVEALRTGTHTAGVFIDRSPPRVTHAEAHAGVLAAEALIGEGITLEWDDGEGRLERADLVRALVIEPRPDSEDAFAVSIDPALLAEVLFPITAEIDIAVQDASFRLVDGSVTLVSKEKKGRATDSDVSVAAIISALENDEPGARLLVIDVDPEIRARQIGEIALPDLLGDSFTYYGNSSDPRRQNVERAVDLEGGWLVPPGGVFSYVEYIGNIDEESGFATGFGIVADEEGGVTTAPVIGGGICQVSTTIFQAAFWSGLQIEERWQHPYWLTSYGEAPRGMKGLDAMVNVEDDWALDMKFRNTTSDWIAVVVTYDGQNVTAQILGTDPGWNVMVSEPVLRNVVPKDEKMYYTESPELPAGQEMLVESALEGFDSAITRTIVKDGAVIDEYVLTSSFAPSKNTILRGTGTD